MDQQDNDSLTVQPKNLTPEQAKVFFNKLNICGQLILDSFELATRNELVFHILNKSVNLFPYHRSILFDSSGCKMLGISGNAIYDKNSSLCEELHEIFNRLKNKDILQIVSVDCFMDASAWREYSIKNDGTTALLLPLVNRGIVVGILWFERWNGTTWSENDLFQLDRLAKGYGASLSRFAGKSHSFSQSLFQRRVLIPVVLLLIIVFFLPKRYAVIAECEVVAEKPYPVTAETEGVVNKIAVKPGETVVEGQLLVSLDKQAAFEELKAYEQQVRISYADYQRASIQSFEDEENKREIELLANKLKQDEFNYNRMMLKVGKMTLHSKIAGVVIMPDPDKWEGKPVMIGERIMEIADPTDTKIHISLPVDDRQDFPAEETIAVILNADVSGSRDAKLSYIASHASFSPSGKPEYAAEAEWTGGTTDVRIGMKGIAILYGRKTCFGLWVLRRPLFAIRKFFGF